MNTWRIKLAVVFSVVLSFLALPMALADTQDFSFDSFEADYYLSRNGEKTPILSVEEKLVARFQDFDQNHGILRAIPQKYQGHTLSLKVLSVTGENSAPYNYTTYDENDNQVLKIGDADRYVRGIHTYQIKYEMRNVINYQPEQDEFYWDINGDQWPQTFGKVVARIHIPAELSLDLQDRQVCYAGSFGAQGECEISRANDDAGVLVTASAQNIQPFQTLTIALAFNKSTFLPGPEIAREQLIKKLNIIGALAGGIAAPLVAAGVMFHRWRKFGDDPKGRGIIVPEYQPPKGLGVLDSDFILQQKLRNEAVSALLIDQAVKRHLTIYEIPKKGWFGSKDYELEVKSIQANASKEEKDVLKMIFSSLEAGKRIKLSQYKKDTSKRREFYNQLKETEDSLADRLFQRGFFIKDPKKIKTGYQLWAILPFIGAIGAIMGGAAAGSILLIGLGVGLFFAALVMVIFSAVMPARTQAGVEANDALLGLKDYIKMAEADRLRYLQSPEGAEKIADKDAFDPETDAAKVKLFEKLLPYAMLFSLEKDWAKQFKDLYTQPPDWYQGNWTAFNIGYLSSSVGDFSKASGLVFSAPSSSSGSGFGGGSGGGGGGGGGGGW